MKAQALWALVHNEVRLRARRVSSLVCLLLTMVLILAASRLVRLEQALRTGEAP